MARKRKKRKRKQWVGIIIRDDSLGKSGNRPHALVADEKCRCRGCYSPVLVWPWFGYQMKSMYMCQYRVDNNCCPEPHERIHNPIHTSYARTKKRIYIGKNLLCYVCKCMVIYGGVNFRLPLIDNDGGDDWWPEGVKKI